VDIGMAQDAPHPMARPLLAYVLFVLFWFGLLMSPDLGGHWD
jgi:hypothetical protein